MDFQQALALHHQGRTDEAAGAYELILGAEPAHLNALVHLGTLRLGQGRASEAEALLRRAATEGPAVPEAAANHAAALQALGRYEDAISQYEHALALRPGMHDARFGLAACLQAFGRQEAAIACYVAILAAEPSHTEANYGLATLLERQGRVDEAIARYRAALAGDPDFAEASCGLGLLLARGDTLEEAIGCFLNALDVDPDYIEARLGLGNTLSQLQRNDEAMAAFRAILAAEPDHAGAHNGIGVILDRKRRHTEAIEHFRQALARDPQHFAAAAGVANSLTSIGRHAEALEVARQAAELRPEHAPAAALLGSVLAEVGSIDDALAHFRRAVSLAPQRPEFCYHLVQLAKVKPGDDSLRALEAILPRAGSLSAQEQCMLHFALAKAYDDIDERDLGFTHLLQGNAIKRSGIEYNEATTLAGMEHIARVFTAELMAARKDLGDRSPAPVFIVGMPRSGTTLIEQILASHGAVFGAGERSELSQAIGHLSAKRLGGVPFPEATWTMAAEEFQQVGREYVASLRPLAPVAERIIDKMPINFLHLGMIHLALPNARIIHVRRNPVDTCLSCFSKLFAGDQPFTYELGELGRFYGGYQRLMAHWRSVLPQSVLLEVGYEELVRDLEPQARGFVAHIGLPWDPACLEFYKTSRPVHTASMLQVRQPIYRSSVGRWRPDETLLRPLLDALGDN